MRENLKVLINKWTISKFFRAKRINDDIDAFTNAMQNLMDILSFKISVKNSEKLNELNHKLDTVLMKMSHLQLDSSEVRLKFLSQNEDLQDWMKKISSNLKNSSEAYKTLEYHWRNPGRDLKTKDFEYLSDEEEKKTGCTESEKEVRLSEFDENTIKNSISLFDAKNYEYMIWKVVFWDDGNFEEGEYFKFKGRQCIYSDLLQSKVIYNKYMFIEWTWM